MGEVLARLEQIVCNKARMPAALDAWRVWGQHAGLSVEQQELCLGPEHSVRVHDGATIGDATQACIRVKSKLLAIV